MEPWFLPSFMNQQGLTNSNPRPFVMYIIPNILYMELVHMPKSVAFLIPTHTFNILNHFMVSNSCLSSAPFSAFQRRLHSDVLPLRWPQCKTARCLLFYMPEIAEIRHSKTALMRGGCWLVVRFVRCRLLCDVEVPFGR